SWRTLDREVRAVQTRRKQDGDILCPFTGLDERCPLDHTVNARRLEAKEIARSLKRTRAAYAMFRDILTEPEKGLALVVCGKRARRDQRGRVRQIHPDA